MAQTYVGERPLSFTAFLRSQGENRSEISFRNTCTASFSLKPHWLKFSETWVFSGQPHAVAQRRAW